MKPKLWIGMLYLCVPGLIQPSRSDAQEAPQQPPPAQLPPPAQPPPPQTPATPPSPKPTVERQPSPPPAQASQERDTSGDELSIEPLYWLNHAQPILRKGRSSLITLPGNLNFPGRSKYTLGGLLTIPTGRENSLQLSYFRTLGRGDTILTQDSNLFSNTFYQADRLNTKYTLQNFKFSWNYLTYPYPSNGAKFRIKTLWEVQYVTVRSSIDAPLDPNTSTTQGTKSIILPTFGLGLEYHPAKHFFLELKASGFGFPRRADIWDAEGSAVIRAGRIKILVGGKGYHFKTSPNADQYFTQTLWGPYAGLRLVWK